MWNCCQQLTLYENQGQREVCSYRMEVQSFFFSNENFGFMIKTGQQQKILLTKRSQIKLLGVFLYQIHQSEGGKQCLRQPNYHTYTYKICLSNYQYNTELNVPNAGQGIHRQQIHPRDSSHWELSRSIDIQMVPKGSKGQLENTHTMSQ